MVQPIQPPEEPVEIPASQFPFQSAPQPMGKPVPQPINGQPSGLKKPHRKWSKRKISIVVAGAVVGILVIIAATCLIWYNAALQPVQSKQTTIKVTIDNGLSPDQIGTVLEKDKVIRSSLAFSIYTKLHHSGNHLEAGTYELDPSESLSNIVTHLTEGDVAAFSVTFLPGATLAENRQVLLTAGFTATEVDTALAKTYTGLVFQDKPAGTDLEGYIYGQTYRFSAGTSAEDVLQRTFDLYSQVVQNDDLIAKYASHGLNLYQGITLASIIQREVSKPADQKQVAQVFYSRLASGMVLGSDVTFQYAAKKAGVTPDPTYDSPYNTRLYAGLPPGPIAVPGESALQAVGDPAAGDYLYFISGDDDVTYFATTYAQHEANVAAHCQQKCSE